MGQEVGADVNAAIRALRTAESLRQLSRRGEVDDALFIAPPQAVHRIAAGIAPAQPEHLFALQGLAAGIGTVAAGGLVQVGHHPVEIAKDRRVADRPFAGGQRTAAFEAGIGRSLLHPAQPHHQRCRCQNR